MTVTIKKDVFQLDVPVDDTILRKIMMKIFVSIEIIVSSFVIILSSLVLPCASVVKLKQFLRCKF